MEDYNCYGKTIKNLLRLNPLSKEFFEHTLKENRTNNNKEILLKNIFSLFITYTVKVLNEKSIKFGLDFEIEIDPNTNCHKFKCIERHGHNEIASFSLDDKNDYDFFTIKVLEYIKSEEHIWDDEISELYKKFCKQVWSFYCKYKNNEISEEQLYPYIYFLHLDSDTGIELTDQLYFLLDLFNNLCQSLLKGEYISYDKFAQEFLTNSINYNKIEETRIEILNNTDKSFTEDFFNIYETCYEKNNNKENTDDNTSKKYVKAIIEKFIDILSGKSYNNYSIDNNVLENIYVLYLQDMQTPFKYYFNINNIITDYSFFIERIKIYLEPEKKQHFFLEWEKNPINYEQNASLCINNNLPQVLSAFAEIMEFFFRNLLDMCLIDHNFISTDNNLTTLLRLHRILKPYTPKEQDYCLNNILQVFKKNGWVNKQLIEELENTIKLLQVKNDILLLKMRKRAGYNPDKSIYHEIKLNKTENEEKNFFKQDPKQILPSIKENIIETNYKALINKDFYKASDLKSYEESVTNIICTDDPNFEKQYEELITNIKKEFNNYNASSKEHKLISEYNRAIFHNFNEHFEKYGHFIKKLKLKIGNKPNDEYLKEVIKFVNNNEQKEMLSCAFILKHLKWVTSVLNNDFNKTYKRDEIMTGYKYLNLGEMLILQLKKLIIRIKENRYVMNYNSFFQDCFFIISNDNCLQRTKFPTANEKIAEYKQQYKNVIFIASTWRPNVSLVRLEKKYEDYCEKLNLLEASYNNYYSEKNVEQLNNMIQNENNLNKDLDNIGKEMHKLLSENKKETVQLLGIFAAFLAIATVGLSNFTGSDGNAYVKERIFTICISLGYLILLIQLTTFFREKKYKKHCIILLISISIITILLLLFLLHII